MSKSFIAKCLDISDNLLDVMDFLMMMECDSFIQRCRVRIAFHCVEYARGVIIRAFSDTLLIGEVKSNVLEA